MPYGAVVTTWRLEEEVQCLTRKVSSKFIVEPSINEVRSELLIGLKRFVDSVRRNYDAIQRAEKSKNATDICNDSWPYGEPQGLGTNLRLTNGWTPDNTTSASRVVELFLLKIEKELLDHLDRSALKDTRKPHTISNNINLFLNNLSNRKDLVTVPTDKTNFFLLMKEDLYSNLGTMHLVNDATKTNIKHISNVHEEALKLCKTSSNILSSSEYNYRKSTINKCAIPNVCLLVKDHKEKDGDGNYPPDWLCQLKTLQLVSPCWSKRY